MTLTKAGLRSAIFYSLLASCLRRGLNPRAYLQWLFARIASGGTCAAHTLTPAAYAALIKPEPAQAASTGPAAKPVRFLTSAGPPSKAYAYSTMY